MRRIIKITRNTCDCFDNFAVVVSLEGKKCACEKRAAESAPFGVGNLWCKLCALETTPDSAHGIQQICKITTPYLDWIRLPRGLQAKTGGEK